MTTTKTNNVAIVCSDEIVITDTQSALDFISTVRYDTGCDAVVINKSAVCEAFFDLKTGVAGEILQKFVNYRMKLAVVGDFSGCTSRALQDFIRESNEGSHIFFAATKEEAVLKLKVRVKSDMSDKFRCFGDTPLYQAYHDNEWGRPVHDDRKLFEMLILEGAQAGLSWITVLKKREAYREAFDGFDPEKIALYGDAKIAELMANAGIIRNRLKIHAAITNAKLFLEIQKQYGSFDRFIWGYVEHTPIVGHWEKFENVPITTPISDQISKDLKKMGFKFVGSTIIYSFMQAVGMVNDHLKLCFVYKEILKG